MDWQWNISIRKTIRFDRIKDSATPSDSVISFPLFLNQTNEEQSSSSWPIFLFSYLWWDLLGFLYQCPSFFHLQEFSSMGFVLPNRTTDKRTIDELQRRRERETDREFSRLIEMNVRQRWRRSIDEKSQKLVELEEMKESNEMSDIRWWERQSATM